MPKVKTLVDRATLGASGRLWTLPFDAVTYGDLRSVTFSGPVERDCAIVTCDFLKSADPKLFEEWRTAFIKHSQTRSLHTSGSPHTGCLVDPSMRRTERLLLSTPTHVCANPPPPPDKVDVPNISPEHWYYKRHFTVGSYRAPVHTPDSEKIDEVAQDIASLHFYLKRYDLLAHEMTGQRLFEATTWAVFKSPYYSCMEMCIRDLGLPSHFLALIHHGIGAHIAIGQPYLSWDHKAKTVEESHFLHKTHETFDLLAKLYREDFPKQG